MTKDIEREAFKLEMMDDYNMREVDTPFGKDFAMGSTKQAFKVWQAAKAQAIPDGFVVVPKEPTQELLNKMQDFFVGAFENGLTGGQSIHCAYIAMIEAQEQANDI